MKSLFSHDTGNTRTQRARSSPTIRPFLICLISLFVGALVAQQSVVEAMWFFQEPSNGTTLAEQALAQGEESTQQQLQQQQQQLQQVTQELVTSMPDQHKQPQKGSSGGYGAYGSSLLSIAGIQPSSIAAILNTVGDTGFRYFNIQDQCRNRAACDLGYMLYKRLSFVHNWLIRTSVRTLTDMNNVYTQSWMEGMLGRNCTSVYMSCRQSPLEGLMNLALLQHLAT